jgi:hypothetical protein
LSLAILLVHAAATLFMVGVIWFVQVVHYPLFSRVGPREFASYERAHTRRTGWIVGPPMIAEAGSALLLLTPLRPDDLGPGLPGLGLLLLAAIWLATALLQVPAHRRLEQGFDAGVHRRLVVTNWIRTVLWTLRGILALALLAGGAA